MPPVRRAVINTTASRNSRGRTMEGTCRNFKFRLMEYWNTPMQTLIRDRSIQTCGRPGRKKTTAVMFQLAMSQT